MANIDTRTHTLEQSELEGSVAATIERALEADGWIVRPFDENTFDQVMAERGDDKVKVRVQAVNRLRAGRTQSH